MFFFGIVKLKMVFFLCLPNTVRDNLKINTNAIIFVSRASPHNENLKSMYLRVFVKLAMQCLAG